MSFKPMTAAALLLVSSIATSLVACGGEEAPEVGQTDDAVTKAVQHYGTCFEKDKAGVQIRWERAKRELTVVALAPGKANFTDDFDKAEKVFDGKLDWYELETDERVEKKFNDAYAWTTIYGLKNGHRVKVEGAWEPHTSGEGYPEIWGRFTINNEVHACERVALRRPQAVVALPERLLLLSDSKDDEWAIKVENLMPDQQWVAHGFIKPRAIRTIDSRGKTEELEFVSPK